MRDRISGDSADPGFGGGAPNSYAAQAADSASLPHKWLALAAVSLGVATTILSATVSNVALPAIAADLSLTTTAATWVNAGYALTFASLLLLSGRIADRVGRRTMFVGGTALFAAASILIALSESSQALVAARILQGAAASTILPASLSLLNANFRGRDRAVAFAMWGSIIGGVSALGPLVGGYLIETASWEWAFLINVPIAVATIALALRFVPDSRAGDDTQRLDLGGAVLATLGVGLVAFGIIEGQSYGWWSTTGILRIGPWEWTAAVSPSAVALTTAVAMIVSFIVLERRRAAAGRSVLLDLSLFRVPSFRYGSLTGAIVSLGEFGLLFALPLFLQSVYGYDALETGFVLLGLAGGAFFASGAAAPLANRIGPVRTLRIGMVFEVVGIVGLGVSLTPSGGAAAVIPWLVVYGIGVGLATSQLAGISLSQVPVEQSGQASGAQSTARQLGAAIGTAILGATLLAGLGSTAAALEDRGIDARTAATVTEEVRATAGTVLPALADRPDGQTLVAGAEEGFANAIRLTSWVAAAWVALGLAMTFRLPAIAAPRRRDDDEAAAREPATPEAAADEPPTGEAAPESVPLRGARQPVATS
jgi:EmrB/QacA subfamily drug resistance transporter